MPWRKIEFFEETRYFQGPEGNTVSQVGLLVLCQTAAFKSCTVETERRPGAHQGASERNSPPMDTPALPWPAPPFYDIMYSLINPFGLFFALAFGFFTSVVESAGGSADFAAVGGVATSTSTPSAIPALAVGSTSLDADTIPFQGVITFTATSYTSSVPFFDLAGVSTLRANRSYCQIVGPLTVTVVPKPALSSSAHNMVVNGYAAIMASPSTSLTLDKTACFIGAAPIAYSVTGPTQSLLTMPPGIRTTNLTQAVGYAPHIGVYLQGVGCDGGIIVVSGTMKLGGVGFINF